MNEALDHANRSSDAQRVDATVPRDSVQLYRKLHSMGLQYGPAFRRVEAAWACGEEVAGRLERLPSGGRGPKPNARFPDEAILDAIIAGLAAEPVSLASHAGKLSKLCSSSWPLRSCVVVITKTWQKRWQALSSCFSQFVSSSFSSTPAAPRPLAQALAMRTFVDDVGLRTLVQQHAMCWPPFEPPQPLLVDPLRARARVRPGVAPVPAPPVAALFAGAHLAPIPTVPEGFVLPSGAVLLLAPPLLQRDEAARGSLVLHLGDRVEPEGVIAPHRPGPLDQPDGFLSADLLAIDISPPFLGA